MSSREQVEREYLHAALVLARYYAVDARVERQAENGTVGEATERVYFHLIATASGNKRETTMHTVECV